MKMFINNAKKDSWAINLIDGDSAEDKFMRTFFPGTSILWAYNAISKHVKVARVDIWRYAALYAFGGLYMDDDAFIQTSLEQIVKHNDSMILTVEGNPHIALCYQADFYLSNENLRNQFNTTRFKKFWNDKTLVNWAIFAKPRHPLLLETLKNIVNVIRKEYLSHHSVLNVLSTDRKSKQVICATGPAMLTATALKMALEHEATHGAGVDKLSSSFPVRVEMQADFGKYGGVWKAHSYQPYFPPNVTRKDHYTIQMDQHNFDLLGEYKTSENNEL